MTGTDWEHMPTPEQIRDNVGFIYYIVNKETGRYYIGQKKFWFKRKLRPRKGMKNSRHKLVESDWRTYWGSCMELQKDIQRLGKAKFRRIILTLCKSKAEMNYIEARKQFGWNVLLDPLSYNGIINCRISKNQLKNSSLL